MVQQNNLIDLTAKNLRAANNMGFTVMMLSLFVCKASLRSCDYSLQYIHRVT